MESLSGKLWDELLEREAFDAAREAKVLIKRWRRHDNTVRLHSQLGHRPPAPEAWQPVWFLPLRLLNHTGLVWWRGKT